MLECKPHYWEKSTILDSGCKARIVFKEMSTLAPYNANKSFILDVRSGLTVGDLHGLIVQHDRHKYEFDSGLHNDRFWVADQINLFTRHGVFTNQDEVVELNRQMRKRWPSQAPAPLELEKGAYYG